MTSKGKVPVVAVNGACGRMGGMLVRLIAQDKDLRLGAALERAGEARLGEDVGTLVGLARPVGVQLSDRLDTEVDVMIDFSLPAGTMGRLETCVERKIPMVIGTTGLDALETGKVEAAAKIIPIVFAPNMSVGVNLLLRLVGEVAQALGEEYDVEIVEMHHRFKKDAPSGTALKLAEAIAKATGRDLQEDAVYGRQGPVGMRPSSEIGIHAVRGGDVVGEHTITFAAVGERVELVHKAASRDTFARGALRAAKFLLDQSPGLYSMLDVLGL
ncbi:MAG: 4-hydroxy-tetrahydrodipicolinate reductase [Planctomycetes bacterium DG_58]|nr:MAG: 4-hydroxy-tetrahydrodipicolinate reductase [Planctomycetes bacterium DG_58]